MAHMTNALVTRRLEDEKRGRQSHHSIMLRFGSTATRRPNVWLAIKICGGFEPLDAPPGRKRAAIIDARWPKRQSSASRRSWEIGSWREASPEERQRYWCVARH